MEDILLHKKISEFRKSQKLTISQLANLVDMTPSMLSQIERGTANPSINTLKLIANALDIPIYRFFINEEDHDKHILRKKNRKRIHTSDNHGFSYELLTPDVASGIELILMEIEPEASSSNQPMGHKGEEIALVLSGSVQLQLNNRKIVLHKGDSVQIEPQYLHKWYNPFEETTKVLFAVSPAVF